MGGLCIEHGRWVDSRGKLREERLVVRDGRIRLGASPEPADRVIDAAGALVLPGAIDAHTHLREPGQEYKEGIDNGTKAAVAGGVTTVLDMPNDVPPTNSAARLAAKAALFRAKSRVNWGLHVQAPVDEVDDVDAASAKVYMAKSSALPALTETQALQRIFAAHRRVAVHAEDETRFLPAQRFGPRSHHLQRPREAVVSALPKIEEALLALPEGRRPRLVLCHASTSEEVAWLARMKAAGHDVWGETCPHYLLLSEADYVREGPRLKVNPPLRTAEDVAAIRGALKDGSIDFISSDHAPHTPQEKADEATAPSGIPGIEWTMPLLLSLVDAGLLDLTRLVEVASRNAARCYGIAERGEIADGARADVVVVSKRPGRGKHAVISRAGYDPYPHLLLEWAVEATIVSGTLAYLDGKFEEATRGQEVIV
jgi:dihydroorotase